MNAKNFEPHLFIELSDNGRRFTLRKTALQTLVDGSTKVISIHLDILPVKLTDAVAKAQRIAYEEKTVLRYDAKRDQFPEDLDVVAAEKRAARANRKTKKQIREDAIMEGRANRRAASEANLDNGVFPFGKNAGRKFEDVPDYCSWMVSKKADFEQGSLLEYAAKVIESKYSHLLKAKEPTFKPGYRSEKEKSRIEITGKVIRVLHFTNTVGWNQIAHTYWVFIKDQNGLCVVAKGGWYAEVGDDVNITAFLKAKEIYKGQEQTIVNRVKGA